MGKRLALGAVVALAWSVHAVAAGLALKVPADGTVRIQARVGDDAAFVGGLTLESPSAVAELTFRSSDLVRTDDGERIRGSQVSLVGVSRLGLEGKVAKDLDIKVGGIKLPGVYRGRLYFMLPSQAAAGAFSVPIEVTALGVPKLTQRKGSEAIKIQLVNCRWLGCDLARALQPAVSLTTFDVMLDNGSPQAFAVTVSLAATGEVTRGSVGEVIRATGSATVEPDPTFKLPIAIDRSPAVAPLPDHYVGDVQLKAAGPEPLVKIPLEVNVRSGPVLPIIVVIIGIYLGKLVKHMSERGNAQSDVLSRFHNLKDQISTSPADRQLLDGALEALRTQIYEMRLDEAKSALTAVTTRWNLLNGWRRLEQTLSPRSTEPDVAKILRDIQRGRNLIALQKDADAATLAAQIDAAVQALDGGARPVVADLQYAPVPPVIVPLPWYRRWSGPGFRAELTLRVVRPLLYLMLVVFLVVIGLLQLYLKNATFGSDPVSDYFGLLLWAMSSDVASRSLAGLKV